MRLVDAAEPTFSRHETFHPRYGWFKKAYAEAACDPQAFNAEHAPIQLGVGKNMVRSIRFWGLAAKLITDAANLDDTADDDPTATKPVSYTHLTLPTKRIV